MILPPKLKPLRLTKAECLALDIYRAKLNLGRAGILVADYADRYGAKPHFLAGVLKGRIPYPRSWPIPDPGSLTPGEHCWILRRRSGWTVSEMLRRLGGVCVETLLEMEQSIYDPSRLYRFWEKEEAMENQSG